MSDRSSTPGVAGRPFVEVGRVKRRLRFEVVKEDAWVGLFWKRRQWWGGFDEAVRADVPATQHRRLDWYVCLLPMVPLHYTAEWCPAPNRCTSLTCTATLVRRCPRCRDVVPRYELDRSNLCFDCDPDPLHSDETTARDDGQ